MNNRKYINYQYTHCRNKQTSSNCQGMTYMSKCCVEGFARHSSREVESIVAPRLGGGAALARPLCLFTKDCTLPLEGTVAFITEWFPYTGFPAATRYLVRLKAQPLHGLTRLLRLACSHTNTDEPISPAVGHNMPYAQLPIVHCPMPIAHNCPPKLALGQEKLGVKSFSVVNKEESFSEREQ